MRLPAVVSALVASLAAPAAMAHTPSPGQAAPSAPFEVRVDIPQDKGPQVANVLVREFPVGGGSGWHVHPGTEVAYLLAGRMSLEERGKPMRMLDPGDSFVMPRGTPHNGRNVGSEPARLVITYLVDRDAPVRSAVGSPEGK